jgi:SAM-dependent methyltransferase
VTGDHRSQSRSARDRALFNAAAGSLHRKDVAAASRQARRHRLLQSLRPFQLPASATVLEVGCGAGFAAAYLRGRYGSYLGIDHSEELIDIARRENAWPGVRFEAQDAAEMAGEPSFDLIFMIGVLHHLEEPGQVLAQLARLLRPGGWVMANEPQPANPLISFARRLRSRMERNYSSEQEEIPRARLEELFTAAGLGQVRVLPQGLVSTPFAEVVLGPQWLTRHLAGAACAVDRALEAGLGRLLMPFTWNLIAVGQRLG